MTNTRPDSGRVWTAVSVLVPSGRGGSGYKVGTLEAGADDYVTKPFAMEELYGLPVSAVTLTSVQGMP